MILFALMSQTVHYKIDESNLERQRLLAKVLNPLTSPFLARVSVPQNARCLDVACGIGETTRLIRSAMPSVRECIGLELDAALITEAKRHVDGLAVRFEHGDARSIPFADGSFDFVFARYLMMHLPEPETVIREMMRVTRKGGTVMLVEPDFSFQASHPPSWAYERLPELLRALLPDPFIGRKLGHMLREAEANEVHMDAVLGIEHSASLIRRTWRLTVEAMGPALLANNILSPAELTALIEELTRAEQDPNTVLLYNPVVFAWAQV